MDSSTSISTSTFLKNKTSNNPSVFNRPSLHGCLGLLIFLVMAGPAAADRSYEVTVYNLSHGSQLDDGGNCREGEIMGLFMFATHNTNVKLFELGEPASPELALGAEAGFPYALAGLLETDSNVGEIVTVPTIENIPDRILDGIVCAGDHLTVTINAEGKHRFLSLMGMIAPTNDGFVALNRVRLPLSFKAVEYFSPAYDAGSEFNDEICDNIPGLPGVPGCSPIDNNTDFSVPDPNPEGGPGAGEGYVHVHTGIHGIADLEPSIWDWRNPVAKITVRRIR